MGAVYRAPKIGAMRGFRKSVHSKEQILLRDLLIDKRSKAGLTQRELALRLGVVHSLVGKVEKGERRLDVIEFISYCEALGVEPNELLDELKKVVD